MLMSSRYETELWLLHLFSFKIITLLGRRPTGRTQDFGSCNRGSNPRAPVIFFVGYNHFIAPKRLKLCEFSVL